MNYGGLVFLPRRRTAHWMRCRSQRTISAGAAWFSSAPETRPWRPSAPRISSRSSRARCPETYDLLKRPDEFFIVNKAHQNPRFVEDVVRGILVRALDVYADFDDGAFLFASQTNDESIHKHDAFAEAYGTFGEFREELRTGRYVTKKTDLATWLHTRPSAVVA